MKRQFAALRSADTSFSTCVSPNVRRLKITLLILSISTNFAYSASRATGAATRTPWQKLSEAARIAWQRARTAGTGNLGKPTAEAARATKGVIALGPAAPGATAQTGLAQGLTQAERTALQRPPEFMQQKQPAPVAPKSFMAGAGTKPAGDGIPLATAPVTKGVMQRPTHTETFKRPASDAEAEKFITARREGDLETVRKLLQSGIDPDSISDGCDYCFPLGRAVARGDIKMAELLLDFGSNVNNGALETAINESWNPVEMVKLLVQRGASASEATDAIFLQKYPALVGRKTIDAITYLVEHGGADVNAKRHRGPTLLGYIIGSAYDSSIVLPLVKLFINKGANVNEVDSLGDTPLLAAINHGDPEVIALLLHHGADSNVKGNWGTPLMKAAMLGKTGVIKLFHERGIDVSDPEAVKRAIGWDNPDTALVLLELNPASPNIDYQSIIDLVGKKIQEERNKHTPEHIIARYETVIKFLEKRIERAGSGIHGVG